MAAPRLCSIPDCGKTHKAKGFCGPHYELNRKAGTPFGLKSLKSAPQKCSVNGCERTEVTLGLCNRHYKRQWRYGDPSAGSSLRAPAGEPLRWLIANVSHIGEDCLPWPFACDDTGYGVVMVPEKTGAHREMCRRAHGEPPTPEHEAAHSCCNPPCVNQDHLRWATPTENSNDRLQHGTMIRGADSHNAKLTEDDVRRIRSLRGKLPQQEIAEMFGVHQATVSHIQIGTSWGWLT